MEITVVNERDIFYDGEKLVSIPRPAKQHKLFRKALENAVESDGVLKLEDDWAWRLILYAMIASGLDSKYSAGLKKAADEILNGDPIEIAWWAAKCIWWQDRKRVVRALRVLLGVTE